MSLTEKEDILVLLSDCRSFLRTFNRDEIDPVQLTKRIESAIYYIANDRDGGEESEFNRRRGNGTHSAS